MSLTPRFLFATSLALLASATTACTKKDSTTKTDTTTTAVPAPPPPPAEEKFSATMDGPSEKPKGVTTGATGTADFTIGSDGSITYTITVNGLSSNPTASHIHGPADANTAAGPIVTFDSIAKTMTGTLSTGTIDAAHVQGGISMDSLKTLMRNGMVYVNVHTTKNKDGEIRGQITKR